MKNLSLKVNSSVFNEIEKIIVQLNIKRNDYIVKAIEHYNLFQKRKILSDQLKIESSVVQEESLKILAEFEKTQ